MERSGKHLKKRKCEPSSKVEIATDQYLPSALQEVEALGATGSIPTSSGFETIAHSNNLPDFASGSELSRVHQPETTRRRASVLDLVIEFVNITYGFGRTIGSGDVPTSL